MKNEKEQGLLSITANAAIEVYKESLIESLEEFLENDNQGKLTVQSVIQMLKNGQI